MKLLIDECLSEELAKLARDRRHPKSSHIRWIGKGGAKDWELLPVILDGDWTFVTKNSWDFRGPPQAPGTAGQYAGTELHAGLVCLNGPVGMDLDLQLEMFAVVPEILPDDKDLVNQAIEVTLETVDDGAFTITRYALPPE